MKVLTNTELKSMTVDELKDYRASLKEEKASMGSKGNRPSEFFTITVEETRVSAEIDSRNLQPETF